MTISVAERTSTFDLRRSSLAFAGLALVMAVGFLFGLRSSVAAHHPHYLEGTAIRYAGSHVMFEGEDGTQVDFSVDGLPWKSASAEPDPEETPSCLREQGSKAPVRVGVIEVTRPFGSGSYLEALSLACL